MALSVSATFVNRMGNDLLTEHYFSFVVWAHIIPGAYVIEYVKKDLDWKEIWVW